MVLSNLIRFFFLVAAIWDVLVSKLPYDMLRVLEENGPHDLDLTPEIENKNGWRQVRF